MISKWKDLRRYPLLFDPTPVDSVLQGLKLGSQKLLILEGVEGYM